MAVPCVWTPGCGIPGVLYEQVLKRRFAGLVGTQNTILSGS